MYMYIKKTKIEFGSNTHVPQREEMYRLDICAQLRFRSDCALRSLIRIFIQRILDNQGCKVFFNTDNEDTNQTARLHRLIWVFVGRTL